MRDTKPARCIGRFTVRAAEDTDAGSMVTLRGSREAVKAAARMFGEDVLLVSVESLTYRIPEPGSEAERASVWLVANIIAIDGRSEAPDSDDMAIAARIIAALRTVETGGRDE